jgi:hypothetical protein
MPSKRKAGCSSLQNSKKPAHAENNMILAWSQKESAEQEATAAAKKAEEATQAAEVANAKAASAAAAAAASVSVATAAKKTAGTSTALVKAYPKPYNDKEVCDHVRGSSKKRSTHTPTILQQVPKLSMMDAMKRTAVSAALDKNPLGAKAAGTQEVEKERAAGKCEGNKQGGSMKGTEAGKGFQQEWFVTFSWLKRKEVERIEAGTDNTYMVSAMFCILCEGAGMLNTFTMKGGGGCTSMRRCRLTEHEVSTNHKSAVEQEQAAHEFKVARYKVCQDKDSQLINLVIQVYGIFKLNDSLNSFAKRCCLAEISSVQVKIRQEEGEDPGEATLEYHSLHLGKAYSNQHFVTEIGYYMSEILKEQQAKRVSKSIVFSHAIDEASDRAKKTACIQYVCFIEDGVATQEFANLIPIEKADAESIYDADCAALAEMFGGNTSEMHKKHLGFSSDGASVMTGKDKGVAARYKRENPRLTSNHCVCHKTALCSTNASEVVSEIGKDFTKELHSMYNHFNLSVKKRFAFAAAQRKIRMKEAQMKKNFFTRWLSMGDATASARRNVLPLHMYLAQGSADLLGDTAPALVKTLERHGYLLTLSGMNDILDKMNLMNVLMQKNVTSFRSVRIV